MIKAFNGKTPRIAKSAFISEWAYIVGDVEIGENSSVWPGAVIRADFGSIKMGENVSVQDNCVLHADGPMEIGDNVMFGHCAAVHASKIGDNVLIGMNATLLPGAEIGDYCIIGALTLVTERMKIPSNSFATGIPAKVKKKLSKKVFDWVEKDDNSLYSQMAQKYREEPGF